MTIFMPIVSPLPLGWRSMLRARQALPLLIGLALAAVVAIAARMLVTMGVPARSQSPWRLSRSIPGIPLPRSAFDRLPPMMLRLCGG